MTCGSGRSSTWTPSGRHRGSFWAWWRACLRLRAAPLCPARPPHRTSRAPLFSRAHASSAKNFPFRLNQPTRPCASRPSLPRIVPPRSFAENMLRFRDERGGVVFQCDATREGSEETWSSAEIYAEVSRVAAALRAQGVKAGDRVAGYMPNTPYSIIAALGAIAVGAVWSSWCVDAPGEDEPPVVANPAGAHLRRQAHCHPFSQLARLRREGCPRPLRSDRAHSALYDICLLLQGVRTHQP